MNIVFAFADQMHAFALGCMGNTEISTPHLDRLASQGLLFRNCYSNAPVCTPFRGMLFTGRYPSQTGVTGNNAPLPPGESTLAGCLNAGEVRTSYVGKWHLGGTGNTWVAPELRGGFQEFIGYQCYNDYWHDVWFFDEAGNRRSFDRHRTDATTDIAIERLGRLAHGDEPFALFVSYQNPHYPVQPAPEYEALYEGRTITRRPNCQNVEPFTPTFSPRSPRPLQDDPNYARYGGNLDAYLRLYYAMITQLDGNIGRLCRAIDELGIRDETAIIFTSDHGDMQGSHGLINKCQPYEESTRIPLIISAPDSPRGSVVDALVSGIDFFPTFLHLMEVEAKPDAEGRSLVSVLLGDPLPDRPVFAEDMPHRWFMVRDGRYKLIVNSDDLSPRELFDLGTDPYELRNLVDNPNYNVASTRLHSMIREWRTRVAAS